MKDRQTKLFQQILSSVTELRRLEQDDVDLICDLKIENARLLQALEFIANKCSLASDPVAWPVAYKAVKETKIQYPANYTCMDCARRDQECPHEPGVLP